MGITWMCKILLTAMIVILIIIPIAAILITVEIMTRKRVQRGNRNSVDWIYVMSRCDRLVAHQPLSIFKVIPAPEVEQVS